MWTKSAMCKTKDKSKYREEKTWCSSNFSTPTCIYNILRARKTTTFHPFEFAGPPTFQEDLSRLICHFNSPVNGVQIHAELKKKVQK